MSVVVCTRNRPELIEDCLRSLCAQRYADLEVLIIDQSTDAATAEIAARVAATNGRIGYVASATVGLSRARNIGIERSTGDIVAFTDDDCVCDVDWVESLVRAFAAYPDAAGIYGRVLPWNKVPKGERPVALKTHGSVQEFAGKCNPWSVGHGNNMAFLREVFESVVGFDEVLGPGGLMRNCDDADFTYRVLRAGYKVVYSPAPLVRHKQFRRGKDRWRLEKDYGTGAGALYVKHLKSGDAFAVKLLLDRWIRAGALHLAYGVCTGQMAHVRLGWYRVIYSMYGMWMARKLPIDAARGVFVEPDQWRL